MNWTPSSTTGRRLGRLGLVLVAGLTAVLAAGGAASQPGRTLMHSLAPPARGVTVVGEAPASAVIHFQFALPLRDYAGLARSNQAGKTMSYAVLEARHLPTVADYDAVVAWASAAGLTIEATRPDRLTLEVAGSVATLNRALGVHFSSFVFGKESFIAADSEPVLPQALAGRILSINGLQPQIRPHTHHVTIPLSATRPAYYPAAWISGYAATGLGGQGAGATTAIVIDTFPNRSDLTRFWSLTGVHQSLSRITFIRAVPGVLPTPSGEESLDVETASSIAPLSKVRVYASTALAYPKLDTAIQAVITDMQNNISINEVSISIGGCETNLPAGQASTDDNFFSVLSSLGASVFISTGDKGSHECGAGVSEPEFYSTSPNVTAVGGTTLRLNSAGAESAEVGWSGSGGGVSTIFATPSYQSGLSAAKREVPDVAADANPYTGALIIVNGNVQNIGGTSLATPIWAGLMALVNSSRLSAGKSGLGLLNGQLYPLRGSAKFRDITAGNNGGYQAGVGYDMVTGIGAPVMSQLLPALVALP